MSKSLTGDRLKHITIKGKRLNELPQLPILDTTEMQGDLKDLPKVNYEKLVKTHLKHGIFLPFYVWESPEGINYIADGHQRRRVLPNEGYTGNVPVVYIEAANMQEAKEKLLVISSQYGRITQEGYDEFTFDLPDIGEMVNFDALSFEFGQDEDEEPEQGDAEPQIDRAAELQEQWGTERGQLWAIGEHRLLCGDSTVRADVERVMGGEKADAVLTDPPYGIGVEYATFTDTEANTESVVNKFMPIVLAMDCPIALTPGVPVMWNYPQPAWVMVWVHPAPVGGCAWGFNGVNPILVYGKDPYLAKGLGRRPDHIVMAAGREGVDGHPTPKPIKVWEWLVERVTVNREDLIFDPFGGSGTTMVACQNLGRKCRMVEISPSYVAVVLQRMSDAFPNLDIYKVE